MPCLTGTSRRPGKNSPPERIAHTPGPALSGLFYRQAPGAYYDEQHLPPGNRLLATHTTPTPVPDQHRLRQTVNFCRQHCITIGVMLVMLGLTLTAWLLTLHASQQRAEEQFRHRAEQERSSLLARMQAYEQTLRNAAALFASGKPVSRQDWQLYVASLDLKQNLPGVQGVGFTQIVAPEQKSAHEAAIRNEGFLHYRIHPPGKRDIYSSIIWLEPFGGRNLRAFGYDMYSEPTRRQAMQRARDSGKMAMTGKLQLVQETHQDTQPGFLMYFPVYQHDLPHNNLQQRQFALQGFVYSPFRAHDLMHSILTQNNRDFDVELFAGDVQPQTLLYASHMAPPQHRAEYRVELPLQLGEQNWRLRFHSQPEFEASVEPTLANSILIGGIGGTALLWLIVNAIRRSRQQLEAHAAALHASREDYRTLIENMPGVVFRRTLTQPWQIEHISSAIETLCGVSADDFISGRQTYAALLDNNDLARLQQAVDEAIRLGQPYELEYRLNHRNGRVSWVHERAQVVCNEHGAPQRLTGVLINITAKKQAEADLRSLTDTLPLVVFRYRQTHEGNATLSYVSAAITLLSGLPVDQVQAQPHLLLAQLHPQDRDDFILAARQSLQQQQPLMRETRLQLPDGRIRWLYLCAAPQPQADGQIAYHGFAEDVTERKRAAETIRESEERYRRIVETANEGIWSMDGQFRTTFVNAAMLQMLGYSEADMLGRQVERFMFEEDLAAHRSQMAKRNQGQSGPYERRFRRKDGSECWCLVSATALHDHQGHFTGSFAMFSDITAIKQAELAIAEREALLQQIFDTSSVAIFLVNKAGVITHANQRMAEMFGYTLQDMIGSTYVSHIHPSERALGHKKMLALLASGIPSVDLERRYWRADGSEFWGHLTGKPFVDAKGQETGLVGVIADISQRRQAEDELRIAATTFQIQDGLVVTDASGVIVRVNQAFSDVSGYSQEEAIGQTPAILNSGQHDEAFYREMWSSLLTTGKWQGEIWNKRKNGDIFPEWLTITAVRDVEGRISHYVGAYRDISEHKAAEEAIRNLAFYDPLTSLPNRRLLLDRLQQGMATSARNGLHGALIFIDLDNFKTLNDTLGHDLGDLLLVEVAKRLLRSVREGDTVARLGGDEFVIMLAGLHPAADDAAAQAEAVGHNIIAALNPPFRIGKHDMRSTPSLGIALFKGHEISIETLLKRADLAMYQAKAAGRNTLRFFDPDMQAGVNARISMENALYRAIENHEFTLYYQPQTDMAGQICSLEALLRWHSPQRGLVMPAEFIAIAEETGQILPIGHWVLLQACQQLQEWQAHPQLSSLSIAVNISAKHFRLPMFVDEIRNLIRHTGINPARLRLELTETALLANINDAVVKMRALQGMGVRFALDDFGTGYSSLAYLKKLPLDQVKIDRSFVRNLLTDPDDAAICRAVIAMGHSLGLTVVAEGLETASQRDFLLAEGCSQAQGNLFAAPMPAADVPAWLATRLPPAATTDPA